MTTRPFPFPALTSLRRARALLSAVRLVRNPDLLGEVFEMADAVSSPELLRPIALHLALDPDCARALAERPRLGSPDLRELARHAEGTLARAYAEHMIRSGLDPSAIPSLPATDELSFLRAHLYETHDVWHAVTGFGTDVAGELGLQAFYLAQFPSRLAVGLLAGGLMNTLFFSWNDRDARIQAIVLGYAMGRRARPLFGVRWSELWEVPVDEVRQRLGVDREGAEASLRARAEAPDGGSIRAAA